MFGRLAGLWLFCMLAFPAGAQVSSPIPIRPRISGHTLDGKAFDLTTLRGRPVLVMLWATWCPICRREMPWLLRTRNRLAPQGLEIVAVSIDDDVKLVKQFVGSQALSFPVLWRFDLDHQDDLPAVRATPTFYLLAPDGRLLKKYIGALPPALLETWLHPYR